MYTYVICLTIEYLLYIGIKDNDPNFLNHIFVPPYTLRVMLENKEKVISIQIIFQENIFEKMENTYLNQGNAHQWIFIRFNPCFSIYCSGSVSKKIHQLLQKCDWVKCIIKICSGKI